MREEEERIPLVSGSSSLLESEEEELEMTAVTLVWAGCSLGLGGSSTEGCSLGFGGSSSELESDSRPSDEKSNQYGR